jgi:hypothetical protein
VSPAASAIKQQSLLDEQAFCLAVGYWPLTVEN